MKKYIDADALMKHAGDGVISAKDIEDFPKADVKPVQHGWWVRKQMKSVKVGRMHTLQCCNLCNHAQNVQSPFCGGCGARMDGVADD